MGIDVHGLNFLRYAASKQAFGQVATIGRQGIHVHGHLLRRMLATDEDFGRYCEDLLIKRFAATSVESFDNSEYEGATVIHDFNQPIVPKKTYDTVIDFGSLEHLFNVSQALANVSALCRVGGQILHALPANNYSGHGFWQFSPELFFSLYSDGHGYGSTEIFLADVDDEQHWYEVKKPEAGKRANIISTAPLVLLVRTVVTGPVHHDGVQQSDYVYAWEQNRPVQAAENPLQAFIRRSPALLEAAITARSTARKVLGSGSHRAFRLSARHPYLRQHRVRSLLNHRAESS